MAYMGNILDACGAIRIDCAQTYIVAVSGDGPNVCGHLLLYASGGRGTGYYFHVAELHGYPRYMDDAGYRQYLAESGKTELRRFRVRLPNPQGAQNYLEQLLAAHWTCLVVPNNCVSFVEEVIRAGGGSWGSYSNCPTVATEPTVAESLQAFYFMMERGVYNLHGVSGFGLPRYGLPTY